MRHIFASPELASFRLRPHISNVRPHIQQILALGGGGFLMEEAPSPIDAYMLSLTGKSKPKVCFVSTPSGDHPEHIDKFYAAFGPEACMPSHLAFFRKPIAGSIPLAHLETGLLDQDLIFVGGGNTKSALGVWREWRLDEVFRRASLAGVVLAGMSAGAMCWFESGLTDSFWGAGYQPLPCLGLLPGSCGVHHSSEPERRLRLFAALEAGSIDAAVAIDDYAAVLYEGGVISKVVSWREGANAYSLALLDGKAIETPQEFISIGAGRA